MSTTGNQCDLFAFNCEEYAAPLLLGAVWNWCLYGALVVQFYVYSYNFPRDNSCVLPDTFVLVYSIFFLETVQTALSGADLYHWFAAGFGNLSYLISAYLSFFDVPIMGSMVSLSVQFYFAYRIFVLGAKRSWWLCVIICLLSIVGAFGAFTLGVSTYLLDVFIGGMSRKSLMMIWIIANMLSDMLIACAMLYHLRKIWVRDGKLSSHAFVSLVRVTVETNLVTTVVNVVAVVLLCLFPYGEDLFICPAYVFGKLYSNTLLVSLNNRIAIRDKYEARGAVIDRQAMTPFKSSARPRSTTDTLILEPERPQKGRLNQPVAEAGVEEVVNIAVTVDVV